MKRDSTGKFISNPKQESLEQISALFGILWAVYKMLPIIILLVFLGNYFTVWNIFKMIGEIIINIGRKNCNLVCEEQSSSQL